MSELYQENVVPSNKLISLIHFMQEKGIFFHEDVLVLDNKIHKFDSHGSSNKSEWYSGIVLPNGYIHVCFGSFSLHISKSWNNKGSKRFNKDEIEEIEREKTLHLKKLQLELQKEDDLACEKAKAIISNSENVSEHSYLETKQVSALGGVKVNVDTLVIPIYDSKFNIRSLQFISPDGSKKMLYGALTKRRFFMFPHMESDYKGEIYFCEGYATGASIYAITQKPVVCALSASNVVPCGIELRSCFTGAKFIFCGENDEASFKEKDKWQELVSPYLVFPDNLECNDFNDLYIKHGKEHCLKCLRSTFLPVYGLTEYLSLEIPTRSFVVEPFLATNTMNIIIGKSGIGKSFFSYELGLSIAIGCDFLGYKTNKRKVLYIDSEMNDLECQTRLKQMVFAHKNDELEEDHFGLLTTSSIHKLDILEFNLLNEGHLKMVEDAMMNYDVIIMDNYYNLHQSDGNDYQQSLVKSWEKIQHFYKDQISKNKTLILIHHANRSNEIVGSQKMIIPMSTIIKLTPYEDLSVGRNAIYQEETSNDSSIDLVMEFSKHRHFWGKSALPKRIQYRQTLPNQFDWNVKELVKA